MAAISDNRAGTRDSGGIALSCPRRRAPARATGSHRIAARPNCANRRGSHRLRSAMRCTWGALMPELASPEVAVPLVAVLIYAAVWYAARGLPRRARMAARTAPLVVVAAMACLYRVLPARHEA